MPLIRTMKKITLLIAVVVIACGGACAQDVNGDGLTTFLIPINVPQPVPGARGTLWQTELWIHNGLSLPVSVFPPCDILPCIEPPQHAPHVTEQLQPVETASSIGPYIFNLANPASQDVTFSSRLFELSRHTQPAGVEMPVVREDRFYTAPARFIGISGSSASRVALRVYDPRRRVGSSVT